LRLEALNGNGVNGEDDLGVGDEEESEELLMQDPKEWKVSHFIINLALNVWRSNRNKTITLSWAFHICGIKPHLNKLKLLVCLPLFVSRSHTFNVWIDRKKVLKHHPDKKAGISVTHSTNDDAFFKCIQKANEVLTNPERRRQFDSVDPYYGALEEDVPSASDFKPAKGKDGKEKDIDPKRFFDEFGPVFEREARFSKKTPVPMLGVFEDGKEKVEGFYDFWYNFDSWRSFEYLDKEVNEGSDKYVLPPS
jgi:DnaJ family protein C protein 2